MYYTAYVEGSRTPVAVSKVPYGSYFETVDGGRVGMVLAPNSSKTLVVWLDSWNGWDYADECGDIMCYVLKPPFTITIKGRD